MRLHRQFSGDTAPRRDEIMAKIMRRVRLVVRDPTLSTCCYEWTGHTSGNGRGGGYPRMCLDGQTVAVHRVTYTHFHGYVPGLKQIDHKCKNRLCVNPRHLEMVTHKENQRRRVRE